MSKYYKVNENTMRELYYDHLLLMALQNGNVENWEWYGEAIHDFLQESAELGQTLWDIVDEDLEMWDKNEEGVLR